MGRQAVYKEKERVLGGYSDPVVGQSWRLSVKEMKTFSVPSDDKTLLRRKKKRSHE